MDLTAFWKKPESSIAAQKCSQYFNSLIDYPGPGQLLWGSDWPWAQFEGQHDFQTVMSWEQLWLKSSATTGRHNLLD